MPVLINRNILHWRVVRYATLKCSENVQHLCDFAVLGQSDSEPAECECTIYLLLKCSRVLCECIIYADQLLYQSPPAPISRDFMELVSILASQYFG